MRATSGGRDHSAGSGDGSGNTGSSGEMPVVSSGAHSSSSGNAASSSSHFVWELIHLRCTQISGGAQRRTEKVYQLSNR